MIKNSVILFCFLLIGVAVEAQEFRYKADLGEAPATGFYRIDLNSDVRAKSKLQLEDVRISDGKEFVPFVIRKTPPINGHPSTIEFPITQHTTDTGGNTILIIENSSRRQIEHIYLGVKNNVVIRTADIAGSDDGNKWFAIKENVAFHSYAAPKGDELMYTIDFPMVKYKYIRFLIYNNKKETLNIVKAALYTNETLVSSAYSVENPPAGSITQKDSTDGNSYILIDQLKPFPVVMITIAEESTKFFERSATLYAVDDSTSTLSQASALNISSDKKLNGQHCGFGPYYCFDISASLQSRKLMLVIHNGDNPPLKIKDIRTSHQQLMLYTYLHKGKKYQLLFGNPNAQTPNYDLERFSDSIPPNAPQLFYGNIESTGTKTEAKKQDGKLLLWTIIIAAISLLGFFTWKLVREMNNKAG